MQTGIKKGFFEAIALVKEFGFCPVCYSKGKISKSASSTYHCTDCGCTSTFDKDRLIVSYYRIEYGKRVLHSYKIEASAPRWKVMLGEARLLKRKIRRGRF